MMLLRPESLHVGVGELERLVGVGGGLLLLPPPPRPLSVLHPRVRRRACDPLLEVVLGPRYVGLALLSGVGDGLWYLAGEVHVDNLASHHVWPPTCGHALPSSHVHVLAVVFEDVEGCADRLVPAQSFIRPHHRPPPSTPTASP